MKILILKKLISTGIALLFTGALAAQTSAEWLSQKKTQKKYLVQQIAALSVYSGYLSKGYNLIKSGLNTIQKIKSDDANLHTNYFASLSKLNPKLKKYGRIADIIAIQISIAAQTKKAITKFNSSHRFSNTEVTYLRNVINNLLNCASNLNELFTLITNTNLKMKDDERIKAIDNVYSDMLDKQIFIYAFSNSSAALAIQRANEENQLIVSKKINDIK